VGDRACVVLVGEIELEGPRLYRLPEDTPAILYNCPSLPAGTRRLALSTSWDLPTLGPGATASVDVTVPGAQRGDFADASLARRHHRPPVLPILRMPSIT